MLDEKTISEAVRRVVEGIKQTESGGDIPVGVSNRHVHLSREHLDILFGKGYELECLRELKQPGQFAGKELVTIVGPSMRAIENVRILGPIRSASQVEISRTDSFVLKNKPPVRESGDISGSAPVTIIGPKGVVTLNEGCIIANRHIHMSVEDAAHFGVKDGDSVTVKTETERPTVFLDVQIRAADCFALEMHLDTDDANAAGLSNKSTVKISR